MNQVGLSFSFLFLKKGRSKMQFRGRSNMISPSDLGKVKQEVQGSKRVAAEGEKEN